MSIHTDCADISDADLGNALADLESAVAAAQLLDEPQRTADAVAAFEVYKTLVLQIEATLLSCVEDF